MDRAEEYERRAAEMERAAEHAAFGKEEYLTLARHWRMLAAALTKHRQVSLTD